MSTLRFESGTSMRHISIPGNFVAVKPLGKSSERNQILKMIFPPSHQNFKLDMPSMLSRNRIPALRTGIVCDFTLCTSATS